MDYFQFLAEKAIKEAIENGDLENLKGQGEPLKVKKGNAMDEYLSNSGYLPREAALRKELFELREKDPDSPKITALELEINVLREQRLKSK